MLTIKLCLIFFIFLITGCAAIVGGDVAGISLDENDNPLPGCSKTNKKYQLKTNINVSHSSGGDSLASIISLVTLGIIPTYRFLNADSSFQVFENETVIYEKKYNNRLHLMYGFLLIPIHNFSETNKIDFRPSSGKFPLRNAIGRRTWRKALSDLPEFIKRDELCIK